MSNGKAKLTDEQVSKMRKEYYETDVSQRDLADKYDLHLCTVKATLRHTTRRNPEDEERYPYKKKTFRGKYSPKQVTEIRKIFHEGKVSVIEIMLKYEVCRNRLYDIVKFLAYKSAEDEALYPYISRDNRGTQHATGVQVMQIRRDYRELKVPLKQLMEHFNRDVTYIKRVLGFKIHKDLVQESRWSQYAWSLHEEEDGFAKLQARYKAYPTFAELGANGIHKGRDPIVMYKELARHFEGREECWFTTFEMQYIELAKRANDAGTTAVTLRKEAAALIVPETKYKVPIC